MRTDIIMPKMGESLQEGTILKWLKKPGDKVERDEMILEISTDKVDTEVPSPAEGILVEILANENETVAVGTVIARIDTETSSESVPSSAISSAPPEEEKSTEIPVDTSSGQAVSTTDIPRTDGKNFYSPLVRNIAEAEGITLEELQTLKGSGSGGRITKQDLMGYIENRSTNPQSVPEPEISKTSAKITVTQDTTKVSFYKPPAPTGDDVEIIQMDRVRQLIAEHMVYSKQTSPHVTSIGEADVTGIVRFRAKFGESFSKKEGFKLTYTPFFAKAAVDGIREFPGVNVSVEGKNILRHRRIHLSIATALDDGNLIVPVVKNGDSLSISGLARSVYDLSTRARAKKLNPDDIQGGTFSITNVGTFGTLFGMPIINQPQCAIMGIGAITKRPVVREVEGEYLVVIRDMVFVSLTYDHRVIDGMLAGKCLASIIKSLENMNETNINL